MDVTRLSSAHVGYLVLSQVELPKLHLQKKYMEYSLASPSTIYAPFDSHLSYFETFVLFLDV